MQTVGKRRQAIVPSLFVWLWQFQVFTLSSLLYIKHTGPSSSPTPQNRQIFSSVTTLNRRYLPITADQ
jgi:hypothetical protein